MLENGTVIVAELRDTKGLCDYGNVFWAGGFVEANSDGVGIDGSEIYTEFEGTAYDVFGFSGGSDGKGIEKELGGDLIAGSAKGSC